MLRGRTRQRPVVARIAPPIATFAQRGPGGTPGIAIDFIEAEHAAVLRATRAGAEPRQRRTRAERGSWPYTTRNEGRGRTRQCLAALDDPYGVASLLDRLREAGAHEQAAALTARLPATGMFELFLEQKGAADQFRFGREADGTPAAPWGWEDLDLWLVPRLRAQAAPARH
jgi:hypothetical protein